MSELSAGGLLGTKLVPPTIPGAYLRRARLEQQLEAGTSGPVTLVSAGAGSGKTLAVASWARHRPSLEGPDAAIRVAWLALDRDDNEPSLFWSGVVAALRASGAVAEGNPLNGLAINQGLTVTGMRTMRQGFSGLTTGVVLVLDDFHVADHPEILESVAVLLRHESPLRLVLITRTDPVLPLHRLRVNGGLREVRAHDLAFDQQEAHEFFRLNGNHLPTSDVTQLLERTEGWVTGLRLAAMYLTRDSAGEASEFAGDDRAVTEYLLGEVFASQPAVMRDFLLRTCVADRICGDLADVLTGGDHGEQHLETLERANAFITSIGPRRRWYRYHPLLRETLLHQLQLEDSMLLRELHRRAAAWFAENGAPVPSIRHAIESKDWELVGEIFVTVAGPRILSADRQAINEALALIPDAELNRNAALQTCAAARLEYASRYAEMPAVVSRAQRMLTTDSSPYQAATAALIGLWVTAIARPTGDMPLLLHTCSDVLSRLSDMDQNFPALSEYRAVALANQGIGLIWTGQADEASRVLHLALQATSAADMEYTTMGCLGQLALADLMMGRLDDACAWAGRGLRLAEQRGWSSLTNAAASYLALAMVLTLRGQPGEAEPLLRRGALASRESLPSVAIMIAETLVNISLDRPQSALRSIRAAVAAFDRLQNRPEFLRHWLAVTELEAHLNAGRAAEVMRLHPLPSEQPADQWALREAVRQARALLELGDVNRADQVVRSAQVDTAIPLVEVEVWLATALIADRMREDDRARRAMTYAVRAASPQRISLPFLTFERHRTMRLLRRIEAHDPGEWTFLAELQNRSAPNEHPEPDPLTEALTDREMGVLRLLPSMLSNAEIADELFISVNTVKVHLKTLYRKLDAPNRRSAVRRGLALRLIG